ncbi:hypothetical protein ACRQ1B_06590 [Rhizobium panacihumi]|uniref:hypothetical protein n=1 Tax=Rhizobium panacihumi TaxID=2008450 RepID=UPI003D7A6434
MTDLKRLSVSDLIRADVLRPGAKAKVLFEDGTVFAVECIDSSSIVLSSLMIRQEFSLVKRTLRRGERRYFVCPATGRRVHYLFQLPRIGWTTRVAQCLTYQSGQTVGPNPIPRKNEDGYCRFAIEVIQ